MILRKIAVSPVIGVFFFVLMWIGAASVMASDTHPATQNGFDVTSGVVGLPVFITAILGTVGFVWTVSSVYFKMQKKDETISARMKRLEETMDRMEARLRTMYCYRHNGSCGDENQKVE